VWLGDLPVAVMKPKTGGFDIFYVWTDNLGTPRQITDITNQSRWEWPNADPFGNNLPNENPAGLGAFNYNLRFPGQYYDVEKGSNYNYFRDYDPAIGRYVESDPIGLQGGLETYSYAFSDPLGADDSTGLLPDTCLLCIVYAEAGGTSDDCQQAVAAVVFNRMGDSRHFPGQNTPCLVASHRDSRGGLEFNAYGGSRYRHCSTACQTRKERYAADRAFFNSADPFRDNTNNSTYFHDRRIPTPKWISRAIKSGHMVEQRVPGCTSFRFYRIK